MHPENGSGHRSFDKDFVLPVGGFEKVGGGADRLGSAKEQEPAGLQCVVKNRDRSFLQLVSQVDQHVATANKIHPREGRIAREVLPGEGAHVTKGFLDTIAVDLFDEKSSQPLGGDILKSALRIKAGAGFFQGCVIQIGGKDLELALSAAMIRSFQERDRHGVGLLST
jgi:hypothetical protein